jgi:hypothetical protein
MALSIVSTARLPEFADAPRRDDMVEDKSFFRKALDAMIEARSREAARQVDRYTRIYGCDFGTSKKGTTE